MNLWSDLDENAFCQRPSDIRPLPYFHRSPCAISFELWENETKPKESNSNFHFVPKCHDRSLQFVSLKAKKMQWSFAIFRSKIEWWTKEGGKERKISNNNKKKTWRNGAIAKKYQKKCEMHNNNSQSAVSNVWLTFWMWNLETFYYLLWKTVQQVLHLNKSNKCDFTLFGINGKSSKRPSIDTEQ